MQHRKKLLKSSSRINERTIGMKKFMYLIKGTMVLCSLVFITGCSSSELVNIWNDSSFQNPPMDKMLVIAVGKNMVMRRIWEDAFCAELGKHKVTATPSYRLFPDAVPDTNQVNQIVQSKGYDGILLTRRLPTETKAQYQPGYVTQEQNMRYDRSRDRFVTYYRNIEHRGYVDSQKIYIRAIDVWSTMNDGQMIWSATSETMEQSSDQSPQSEIVSLVLKELTKQKIIAP
jgi:hypothetical protein